MSNEMKKLQALIPAELHADLKLLAFISGNTMADLATKAVEDLVNANRDKLTKFMGGQVIVENTDSIVTPEDASSYPEPEGEFCSCSDPDCKGDHR